MNDDEIKAMADYLRGKKAGAWFWPEAADVIEQLMRERDEARKDRDGLAAWITDEVGAELPFTLAACREETSVKEKGQSDV